MKDYNSYEDMQARLVQEEADAAAEQHLLETIDDTAMADAIFDKRRRDPSRSKHDRILNEDEWRKAMARAGIRRVRPAAARGPRTHRPTSR